ncbi:peptidoglycan DD-metalloendopeptidase family protein [Neolewinella antarctica]|uniref:Murein DD-endopeptidase MepM/ murein hydrolase activator NlpD n=1 Tax=Neolewinella antarctica TaxID=442734 RepID=A0ABX0XBG6_9BACT|nr:peptidoglycan DD-metalloendopeptidase family protein [Neolewinella antarctica]NJC26284.1 murein DD-endopeptidase MepM/ murein hydrolase activator NlpD [Neolewinella antarctica]
MNLSPKTGGRHPQRAVVLFVLCLALVAGIGFSASAWLSPTPPAPALSAQAFPMVPPTLRYGVVVDTLQERVDTIRSGQTLSDLLIAHGLTSQQSFDYSNTFNDLFDVHSLRAGKTYTLLNDEDTDGPDYLIYQPSIYQYVKLDLQGTGDDERVTLPVETEIVNAGGVIESNLWNAMTGAGMSHGLTDRMEDALQWSVDFYHVQPDDAFQLVYEKRLVEGEVEAAPGQVLAARYSSGGEDIYAFWYESADSTQAGYYGLNGEPMKSTFLKSPLRFSRMSSAFNRRRFHPVLRRVKAHLGTDYAAPYGTPIMSVADGVIIERGRRGGNGNFVKVKHNETYTTQYLHMQKFAEGQRVGSRVRQGETIGFVGSTGLATGPHVCYRFWENGRQVDHTKLNFPSAKIMPDTLLPSFITQRDAYLVELNKVGQPSQDTQQQMLGGLERMKELKAIDQSKAK